MTENTNQHDDRAVAGAPPPLELWPDAAALRRSRALGGLLILNWLVMGYFVVSQGITTLIGGGAFVLGIVALIGGVSQFRGSRLAERVPIARIEDDQLSYRRYTSAMPSILPLAAASAITTASRDQIVIATSDGQTIQIPTLALSDADRDLLENTLRQRLGD